LHRFASSCSGPAASKPLNLFNEGIRS
jgi:hypothetical protein